MASKNTFGGTVKLEGESEYKKALKDITSDLRVLSSQMGVVTATYGKNNNGIESLTEKNKVLTEQLNKQKEKVDTLRNALEKSKEIYGENSTQTKNWQVSLNKAQSEMAGLENDIKTTEKSMEAYRNATKKQQQQLDEFGKITDDTGKKTISLGDIIKANLISEGIIGGIKALGSALASATKQMASFIKDGIDNASNLQEVQNVVDVTFGNSAEIIDKWSKQAASSYGMSELSAKQYTGTMGAMLKSMQLSDSEVLKMSTDMVGLAGDFASFYNLDSEEAFNKIRAGISGETEPLKQLGINMSVANLEAYALSQGIDKAYNSMTQAEQATLRYNYLMSVSADAQGDFARTSDGFANQQRIAQLQMENFATSIGSFLLPSFNQALTTFNQMLNGSISMEQGLNNLVQMVMNLANKIIEKLPRLLSAGASMLKTIVEGVRTALPQLIPIALELINTLVTTLVEMLPDLLQMGITLIVELVNGIATALPDLIPIMIDAVLVMVETLLDNIDLIIDAGINLIMALADGLIDALPKLIEKIPVIIEKLITAITTNLPKLTAMGIELTVKLAVGLVQAIPQLVAKIPQIVNGIVNGLKAGLSSITEIGKNMVQGLWNGINNAKDWVLNKIKGFGNSILKGIKGFFGIKSPSTVFKDEIGKNLALGIGEGFTDEMDGVTDEIQNSLPKNFDLGVNTSITSGITGISSSSINSNGVNNVSEGLNYDTLVSAFTEALKTLEGDVVLDDDKVGKFVVRTVEGVIYS